jgi:RNA polymerase sigma-54 factor
MKKLAAATGADETLLRAAQALIVACEPKPGRPFTAPRPTSWCPT